jgi:hypothetical protein
MSVDYFETKKIDFGGHECTIILQNANGPCPLVALANTLILTDNPAQHPSLRAYTSGKDRVVVSNLLQLLAEILLNSNNEDVALDTNHVLTYLPKLVSGLNINIRFDGTFEDGPEMALFRMYNVPIVHGWICDPGDPCWDAIQEVGSYDESQALLLKATEVRDLQTTDTHNAQLSGSGTEPQDAVTLAAYAVKTFLSDSPTQLTPYGIQYLKGALEGPAVFFRNDHFATLYRMDDTLFTLVADAGLKNERTVVWHSLTTASGHDDHFYDGDFVKLSEELLAAAEATSESEQQDFILARELQSKEDAALASALSQPRPRPASAGKKQSPRSTPTGTGNASKTTEEPSQTKRDSKKKDCVVM